MIIGLREVIEQFSTEIHAKFPDYATLYEHFLLYMESSHRYNSPDKQYDVEKLFREELTRSDIVNACIYYIEHSKASGTSAIRKFLNAMTKLYNERIAKYHNETLGKFVPFSRLYKDVKNEITKHLQEVTPCAPIDDEDYRHVIAYFKDHAREAEMKTQKEIILLLMMLFGFKFERVRDLKRQNISPDYERITVDEDPVDLPLPSYLKEKFKKYLGDISNRSDYLFSTKSGKRITPAFINHVFVRIKEIANKSDAQISATSLSKYAILKMIEMKVDFITIKRITGMDDAIINDCARIHLQRIAKNDKKCDIIGLIYSMEVFKELDR